VYEEIPDSLGTGADVLREGKDISLIATGHMVWRAMEGRFGFHGKPPSPEQAAEALEELMASLDRQTGALQEAGRRGAPAEEQ
jgi:hypothetical protein